MSQTFFHIPHEIGGWPVFGFGWALLAWCVFSACLLAWLAIRHGWNAETRAYLPVLGVVGAGYLVCAASVGRATDLGDRC